MDGPCSWFLWGHAGCWLWGSSSQGSSGRRLPGFFISEPCIPSGWLEYKHTSSRTQHLCNGRGMCGPPISTWYGRQYRIVSAHSLSGACATLSCFEDKPDLKIICAILQAEHKGRDKARRAAQKAKPLFEEDGKKRGVLDKYDEEEAEEAMQIDATGGARSFVR